MLIFLCVLIAILGIGVSYQIHTINDKNTPVYAVGAFYTWIMIPVYIGLSCYLVSSNMNWAIAPIVILSALNIYVWIMRRKIKGLHK